MFSSICLELTCLLNGEHHQHLGQAAGDRCHEDHVPRMARNFRLTLSRVFTSFVFFFNNLESSFLMAFQLHMLGLFLARITLLLQWTTNSELERTHGIRLFNEDEALRLSEIALTQ